ncbi:MAG: hypothetical protein E6I61_13535 [Chloroflexi bacterium]|nr:MAG: hypothetical protein E6I89_04225 [Chloroflexota bacterium]TME38101.1 MAG: hypothetical protein E6I61_13535 [Chloroflexota bacterium]
MDSTRTGQRLILHPSVGSYFNRSIRNLALPAVAILFMVVVYRWVTVPGTGTVLLGTIVALALVAVAFFGRAEISVGDGVLTYRRFLWRRRFPLESVGGLAVRRLSLAMSYAASGPAPYAVVYGRDGRALFSFSAALWSDEDLRTLHQAIGGSSSDRPLLASELQADFPGALPAWLRFVEAHPVWTIVIGAPLTLVAITIVVVLWDSGK